MVKSLKILSIKTNTLSILIHILVLVFWLLMLVPLGLWVSPDEHYLGSAMRQLNPLEFSALHEPLNHRFLYNAVIGFGIKYLGGIEVTHALGTLLIILLFSCALTYFFRTLKFSILESSIILITFIALGQQILGGENLFFALEPKTFAYICLFIAFADYFNNHFLRMYLFLVLSTYFHFLVGGFWTVVITIFALLTTQRYKYFLSKAFLYLGLCLPLIVLILINQSQSQSHLDPTLTDVTSDWIYSIYRHPHHVSPFSNPRIFKSFYEHGILLLLGLTFICFILWKSSLPSERPYIQLIFVLHCYLLLSFLIYSLDRGGVFGKFYLFRPSSLILFFFLCFCVVYINNRIKTQNKLFQMGLITFLIAISLNTFASHQIAYTHLESMVTESKKLGYLRVLAKNLFYNYELKNNHYYFPKEFKNIIQQSQKQDIFLIDPHLEERYLSLERRFNRPTLVNRKFVPTSPQQLQQWYYLHNQRINLFAKGCPSPLIEKYPVRYLLTHINNNKVNTCGREVYRNPNHIKLIEVNQIQTLN